MAKQRSSQSGPPDKDTFLGGGMQFNKVGTSIPGTSSPPDEEAVTVAAPPAHVRAQKARTAIIVVVLLALVALLLLFGSDTFSGIQHTPGRGGISPSAHPVAPPRNF